LAEKNIRQAIYLAIDRKELSKSLYKGFAKPALDIKINSRLEIDKSYEKRIEIAKQLIADSNFSRYNKSTKKIVLDLDFENSTLRMQEAVKIKNMLKQIDIYIKIRARTKKAFASRIKELNYSGLLLSSFNNLPDTNYYDLLSSNRIPKDINDYTGKNIFSWFNKDSNILLRKYQSSFDSKKRNEILSKINELVYTNVPFSPLYYHPKLVVLPKNVLNFPFNIDDRLEYQISQDWIIKKKKTVF
jgi:ABC-type transport system substrate-binding protein